jgi:putative transposase
LSEAYRLSKERKAYRPLIGKPVVLNFFYMKKNRKKFTNEYKIFAASASIQYGNIRHVAEELGLSKRILHHWKKLFREGKLSIQNITDRDTKRKELTGLRKEIKNISVERDILKKGANYLLLSRQERYKFISENTEIFPIGKMCQVFHVNPSCYYKWIKRRQTNRSLRKNLIIPEIHRIYHASRCAYGSPRITRELASIGIKVCRSFVAKIMLDHNLRSVSKPKFKITTISSPKYPVADNILNQNFQVGKQNEVWVSDMTYIHTIEGWAYLTTIIDLFDRKVIGWSLSKSMKASDTSIVTLKMAILNRPLVNNQKLIFHSDRGVQYACKKFVSLLAKNGISQSMSRKGNCYDNAVAESFFKTLKIELVHHKKYSTRKEASESIAEYIEKFYNSGRRHSALGNFTIEEFQNQS